MNCTEKVCIFFQKRCEESIHGWKINFFFHAENDPAVSARVAHVDPELARYLNRDYWQQRKHEQRNEIAVRFQILLLS